MEKDENDNQISYTLGVRLHVLTGGNNFVNVVAERFQIMYVYRESIRIVLHLVWDELMYYEHKSKNR